MKKSILLMAALACASAVTPAVVAAPALAQGAAEATNPSAAMIQVGGEPPPPPPPYIAFDGDGTVTIDGDGGTSCFDLARDIKQGGFLFPPGYEAQYGAQVRSVVEQCEQGGFLTPDNRYAAFPPAQAQQPVAQAELPTTGGADLSVAGVPLAGGALLTGLAVLGFVARRRTS